MIRTLFLYLMVIRDCSRHSEIINRNSILEVFGLLNDPKRCWVPLNDPNYLFNYFSLLFVMGLLQTPKVFEGSMKNIIKLY